MSVQFNWNRFPSTKLLESLTRDISCTFAPLECDSVSELPQGFYQPMKCLNLGCNSIFNSLCDVDDNRKFWTCCICKTRNNLSLDQTTVSQIFKDNVLEFTKPLAHKEKPLKIFVIDLATDNDELVALKASLKSMIHLYLNCRVALVGFNSNVTINGVWQFNKVTLDNLKKKLPNPNFAFFDLSDPAQFELCLGKIETFEVKKSSKERQPRMTGKALELAINLLKYFKLSQPSSNPRSLVFAEILAFISGPCTEGPGKIINSSYKYTFRNHHTFENLNDLGTSVKAVKYYTSLATDNVPLLYGTDIENEEYANNCEVALRVNILSGCLDESGLFEMQNLCLRTGGNMFLCDSFKSNLFKQNLYLCLSDDKATNTKLFITSSDNLKVRGLIGPGFSVKNHSQYASDKRIGESLTNKWVIPTVLWDTNFSLYFQQEKFDKKPSFIQFKFVYQSDDHLKTRIITCKQDIGQTYQELVLGFDYVTFTMNYMKQHLYKNLFELKSEFENFSQEMDTVLEELVLYFGRIFIEDQLKESDMDQELKNFFEIIGKHNLVPLNKKFARLPILFYHIKSSFLLDKFNISPDETAYYNSYFLQNNIRDLELMVKPRLLRLELNSEDIQEIPLDTNALINNKDSILIFDDFFRLLIHFSDSLAYRRKNYKKIDSSFDFKDYSIEEVAEKMSQLTVNPEVDYVKLFDYFARARKLAIEIISDRFPLPRYVETDEEKSQARFLYSKLRTSETNTVPYSQGIVLKEGLSLGKYYTQICKK